MKIALFLIIGIVLLLLSLRVRYYLLCLLLVACGGGTTNQMDTNKLDNAYFVGEYEVNYENEKEKLILKEDNHYDYIYIPKKDTIFNAGEWHYNTNRWATVIITNCPNYMRKNKLFPDANETTSVSFSVNTKIEEKMCNLSILVNGGEDEYTFIKRDKSKNKNYIKK